jgi:hypothetical protein
MIGHTGFLTFARRALQPMEPSGDAEPEVEIP